MNKQIDIDGVHFEADEDIKKYIDKKLSKLFKYGGRRNREAMHASVKLKQTPSKDKRKLTCEIIFKLPSETITVTETATNMYAAFDIVHAKLKTQLSKYKETKVMRHQGRKQNRVRAALGKILPKR